MRAHSFAIPLFALVFTIPPAAVAAESGANPSLGEDPNPVQHLSLGPFDDEEDMVFRKPHPNMGKNYSVEEFHKLAEGINDFIRAEVDKVEAYRLEAERTRQELWKAIEANRHRMDSLCQEPSSDLYWLLGMAMAASVLSTTLLGYTVCRRGKEQGYKSASEVEYLA